MIRKEFISNNGARICRVTFSLPSSTWATAVHLVGDFNNWSQASHPFRLQPDGSWAVTVEFECGRTYQFRYLIDGSDWVNDGGADYFAPNGYGTDNCILATQAAFEAD